MILSPAGNDVVRCAEYPSFSTSDTPNRMARSIVYSNIHLYRLAMNALYSGGYRERFSRVCDVLGDDVASVCDLCFGDTVIADWCREHGVRWVGFDINRDFCERARGLGFDVGEGDILEVNLPRADVYVMAGSLYHFHRRLPEIFDRVFDRTRRFVLSEPVRNLSSRGGLLGWLGRRSANPGNGDASFRFDEDSLLRAVREQGRRKGFETRVVSTDRDMIIDMIVH